MGKYRNDFLSLRFSGNVLWRATRALIAYASYLFSKTRTRRSEAVYFGIAGEHTRLEQGILHFTYKK